MRIITDIFAYCRERIPRWNTISISGYHIREAGSTAVQEIAFTLANGIAYVQAAIDAGLDVDDFAPRLSFFWNGHNNFFEEVAKFRAARRMWHRIMTERFGATAETSKLLRFHTQTGGSTLTAQQPENNVVRVTRAGARRGARRHAEPPHQRLRRGARPAHRAGGPHRPAHPADHRLRDRRRRHAGPAGRVLLRRVADRRGRAAAWEYIERIDEMGGAVAAIEAGYMQDEIEQAAYEYTKSVDDGERVIVGVNRFTVEDEPETDVFPIDPALQAAQLARLARFKADRDQAEVSRRLDDVRAAAKGTQNLLPPMKEALRPTPRSAR